MGAGEWLSQDFRLFKILTLDFSGLSREMNSPVNIPSFGRHHTTEPEVEEGQHLCVATLNFSNKVLLIPGGVFPQV